MAVAITQTANPAGVATSSNVATYSGVSIGTESLDRVIVVVTGKEVATFQVSSITIDGAQMTFASNVGFGNVGTSIYWLPKPTGTTAEFAVTYSGAATDVQNHIAVYAVTGAAFPPLLASSDTSTDMDASDPLTTGSITIPADGGFLAVAACATDGTAKTWANATEDLDVDAGDFRFTTAVSTTAGTVTVTCTGGTNNEDGALVFIVLAPSIIPNVCMAPLGRA